MLQVTLPAAAGSDLPGGRTDVAARVFGGFAKTPLATWRRTLATQATGMGFDCGHFLMEEKPSETERALATLLRR
jgi:hypothetical protein